MGLNEFRQRHTLEVDDAVEDSTDIGGVFERCCHSVISRVARFDSGTREVRLGSVFYNRTFNNCVIHVHTLQFFVEMSRINFLNLEQEVTKSHQKADPKCGVITFVLFGYTGTNGGTSPDDCQSNDKRMIHIPIQFGLPFGRYLATIT